MDVVNRVMTIIFSGPQQLFKQQQQQQPPRIEPLSEVCLACICESISSCNRNMKCEGEVCGMFGITWAYWADSGKPVLPGDNPNDGQGERNKAIFFLIHIYINFVIVFQYEKVLAQTKIHIWICTRPMCCVTSYERVVFRKIPLEYSWNTLQAFCAIFKAQPYGFFFLFKMVPVRKNNNSLYPFECEK